MEPIGVIERVRRYPVKSMAGEDVDRAFVAYTGVMGDRVYAFVDPEARHEFPWLTARELRSLVRWKPRFVDAPQPSDLYPSRDRLRVEVQTPDGITLPIDDPRVLETMRQTSKREVTLRHSEKGMHDARPVSLISLDTIDAIAQEVGAPVDPLRFRANLYVRWRDREPFVEDRLVSRILVIGEHVELMVSKRDGRCAIVNVDPETAETNPLILKTIAQRHESHLGVYCVVLREGVIQPGDALCLRG